jgi:hypothetical protein
MFAQLWQSPKYESRKILSTLSYCKQLWRLLAIFLKKNFFFDKNFSIQQNICDKKFFFQKYFSQNGENAPPKKSLG